VVRIHSAYHFPLQNQPALAFYNILDLRVKACSSAVLSTGVPLSTLKKGDWSNHCGDQILRKFPAR
jgi:hypothetical protein